ncbi:hypothetical protein [Oleiharenicola lentus]|uniref:hypothetical protein n=1 Tax=Oleiharenicola lentus TaxID=2508720 RepID=UPI003F66694C
MPALEESRSPFSPVTFYVSPREPRLRLAILAGFSPVPITLWLIARAPLEIWHEPFGEKLWWLLPAGLILISTVMPWVVSLLHDRYVLRLERTSDGRWLLTTLLLWGLRTRELSSHDFERTGNQVRLRGAQRLIFDQQGEAPQGWDEMMSAWEQQFAPST